MRVLLRSILIGAIGVFVIDYFSHLLFSSPMETTPYFFAKMALYVVFSLVFLSALNLRVHEFSKVIMGGIVVALLWGTYYNVLPALFDFYPFGISLRYLSFLGMGIIGTGLAFGIVHTLAFIGGYYASKSLSVHI